MRIVKKGFLFSLMDEENHLVTSTKNDMLNIMHYRYGFELPEIILAFEQLEERNHKTAFFGVMRLSFLFTEAA